MTKILTKIDTKDEEMNESNELVYCLDSFESDSKLCLDVIKELSLVSDNNSINDIKIEKICERFDGLINKWQTNPKLIESHLNQFLLLIIQIITNSGLNGHKFNACFKLIQRLVSCIGPKSVCRYFPTEVLWLTKLIQWLEEQTAEDHNSWQTRSVILLWLSIAVKTPFHLRKFDSNEENSQQIVIIQRIYGLIDKYLKASDKCRDSAALLAANFFSRPDIVGQLLNRFMDESMTQIESLTSNPFPSYIQSHFGHVIAVAILFKVADRNDINPFSVPIIEIGHRLDTCNHELIAKWKVKLIGRSALSLMTPRIAKWRYRRGRRLLSQNISSVERQTNERQQKEFDSNEDESDGDFSDIPEQIEMIIDSMLNGLNDPNSTVRWSAAKYMARITNRLPKELASDVVTYVLQLCESKSSDSSIHGCCLALAELSRRGLILTEQLPEVIEVVVKALLFDEIKGSFSVGANVRDAACFVCWSLSRAYESQVIEKFVHKLAPTLVCVACFDREVNCRRAASAAIQEFVGRTNVFPHGLEVLILTDFHLLANRSHCYLETALKLAEKKEFGQSMADHLIMKSKHWDRDIREITAQSFGGLSSVIDMNLYLEELLSLSTSSDLNSRHGSILAIAHIIGGNGHKIKTEFVEQIESIAVALNEKQLLRGMGGELMKSALSVLIEKCSLVSLPIISKQKVFDVWIEILSNSIASEEIKTRREAVSAVPIFCQNYLLNENEPKTKILNQLLKHLESDKESARIGSSECLRSMSTQVLDFDYYNKCFQTIQTHIISGDLMCNSRASEVLTLVELSLKFCPISDTKRHQIFDCLCLALDDRTQDSRGDIGGNVRLSAIDGSLRFLNEFKNEEIIKILKLMTTQCASIWQKERKLAANAFKQIVFNRDLEQIDKQLIKSLFEQSIEAEDEWKPFVQLLRVELFSYNLWRGLVKCVANPTETRVRNLLKQELKSTKGYVFQQFLLLFENSPTSDPLSQCCINCSHFLLTSCRTDPQFRSKLLTLTWNSVRRVKDCRKLVAAIDVFCAGIQTGAEKQSLSYLIIFLCHPFPRIRSQTANQTYVALLTVDDINEEVINLLTETNWTLPLDQLRPIRDRICDVLSISRPSKVSTGANTTK